MKKSLFVLFLYSSLLTASEIAYRFVFGIETLPAAKMAETFALTFVIAALYLFARYKATRLLIAVSRSALLPTMCITRFIKAG